MSPLDRAHERIVRPVQAFQPHGVLQVEVAPRSIRCSPVGMSVIFAVHDDALRDARNEKKSQRQLCPITKREPVAGVGCEVSLEVLR